MKKTPKNAIVIFISFKNYLKIKTYTYHEYNGADDYT